MSQVSKKQLQRQITFLRNAMRGHKQQIDVITSLLINVTNHLCDELEAKKTVEESSGALENKAVYADGRTPKQISLDDFESAMVDHGWASEAEFVAEMERREKYPTNEERIERLNRNFPKHN